MAKQIKKAKLSDTDLVQHMVRTLVKRSPGFQQVISHLEKSWGPSGKQAANSAAPKKAARKSPPKRK
jgi:2-phospho-L-lactate transferase/gluconeogenesis factor (CofD/UPF0052 family)